ncbi:MAG: hypothetical protein SFT90_08260 [Rickettsiales bacterium]|nr:hypothetical protein [Rickettsiales bacterium]
MKISELKKSFKVSAIRKAIISAAMLVFLIAAYYYESSTLESLTTIQSTYTNIESELNSKNFIYNEAQANLKDYLLIPKSKMPSDKQYNLGYLRLRDLVPAIKKLKDLYFFKSLDYSINDILKVEQLSSQSIEAYNNTISFSFQGLTDEAVFSMVEDLKKMLPGFIFIKSFEVIKKFEVDKANAVNFLNRTEFAFVSGRIDLDWLIVQKVAENNPNQPINPPPPQF